jgi:hypothetical protein
MLWSVDRGARMLLASLLYLAVLPAWLQAQAPVLQPPARWSISLESGLQLPATLYDERVVMRLHADSFDINTRYQEKLRGGPVSRIAVRYRSQGGLGLFSGFQFGSYQTEANFAGGVDPPETHLRRVRIWTIDTGVTVRLSRWAEGRGLLEYSVAPSFSHHSIDLTRGHRNTFARLPSSAEDQAYAWTQRSWTSWGVNLGATLRTPVGQNAALRFGVQHHAIPVATAEMENQDRLDVRRMTGRSPSFLYPAYTAHYISIRAGLEYVFSRERVRPRLPVIALPPPEPAPEPSAASRAAVQLVFQGDTTGALDVLRSRIEAVGDDASAWRELALLLASAAEENPVLYDEAWSHLQRAVNLNPADTEILSAYGRLRSLMQRRGYASPGAPALAMSAVSASADPAGGLSLAWVVQNLILLGNAGAQYRLQVQVIDPSGDLVGLRASQASDTDVTTAWVTERSTPESAVSERLELRLARTAPGAYSARVRITDLSSGQALERIASFEIR